jgi:hypothetical protein
LVSWRVLLIEYVMIGWIKSAAFATWLVQRRDQLQPDGDLVTPVMSPQMSVLLLLLHSFFKRNGYS